MAISVKLLIHLRKAYFKIHLRQCAVKELKATCVLSDEPAEFSEGNNDDHNDGYPAYSHQSDSHQVGI